MSVSQSGSPSDRTVITISRQMGSLGREVARATADRLGFRLVWRELINQAAIRCGSPEVALAAIDELGLLGLCPSSKACRAYRQAVRQVMEEIAAQGRAVIIGRAGQVILHDWQGALHIRVIAPVKVRALRIATLQGISLETALAQVDASDRYRHRYLKRYYGVRWEDPDLYDLVINTSRMQPTDAAQLIEQALTFQVNSDLQLPSSPQEPTIHGAIE